MKISLNWLRHYVDYQGTPQALGELLTMAGVEVESIVTTGVSLDKVVVAQILSREQHPNADRLSICQVDDGAGADHPRQIVCGAKNFSVGDKVPLALPGAVLPGDVHIKVSPLRGVESQGMLCSARELRLSEEGEGLLILPTEAAVGAPIAEAVPSDTILDLEITPNRSDLLSHIGLAREVAALTGLTVRNNNGGEQPPSTYSQPDGDAATGGLRVAVDWTSGEACPYYTARIVENVKIGPSPEWLRGWIEAAGVRSINNVVDVTNFVMLEMGQPLHAFDARSIGEEGIDVRQARAGEELLALDGRTYKLRREDLVIARAGEGGEPLALAGVMGGEKSGVTNATTRLVLESAYFTPQGVRRTSRDLGLSSDSSYRFERGVDPGAVLAASRRAVELIEHVSGGRALPIVAVGHLSQRNGRLTENPVVARLRLDRCQQVLGVPVSGMEVRDILKRLGLEEVGREDEPGRVSIDWQVPGYRLDLRREADLIEEVARVYGLDRIPGKLMARFMPASTVDHDYDLNMSLRRRLAGLGFNEARSQALVRHDEAAAHGGVALKNPLNEDNASLRGSLVPGLLAAAARNARQGTADLRLFELGRVFYAGVPLGEPETVKLGFLVTGAAQPASWRKDATRTLDLHDLRGVLEGVASPAPVELRPTEPKPEEGLAIAAEVLIGGTVAGRLGQVAPSRAKELDLRAPVLVAELDAAVLKAARAAGRHFAALPRFPSVTRDLAMIAEAALPHGRVEAVLHGAKEALLTRVELFDVFTDETGEKVPAGKKSLAYSLTYRAEDRTLKTEEVNATHGRLKAALQGAFEGIQFRE